MPKPNKQRGKIIAERVFQRQTPEGTIETIRVGLEEPIEIPVSPDAEPSWSKWECIVYIEDIATFGKMRRFALQQVDSLGALASAFRIAQVFIDGLSIRYGDTVTHLEDTDLSFDLRSYEESAAASVKT